MAYIPNNALTLEYVQSLITRCGFTDVSSEHPDEGLISIRDLNDATSTFYDLASARDSLVLAYVIQQNS